MTTVTVDLERILASGKKNTYEGRAYADLVSCIAHSKRVVCLTGAGISTSAGIPDFRSKDGLYQLASAGGPSLSPTRPSKRPSFTRSPSSSSASSRSSSQASSSSSSSASSSSLKGADLFSTHVFSSAASLSQFYRFISNLNTLSASAEPTPTHRFIRTLANKGKLLRMYTQNIDGLEEKAGLTSANPQDFLTSGSATIPAAASSSKGKNKFQGDLVHLHGRAALVRCTVCTYTGEWTEEISQAYEAGYSMPCSQCQERLSLRKALGKRLNVAVGSLRPAITLYGEHGMEDLFISEISNADVRSRPDCLIIFGTSLKVHGFKQLAKDFAREVEENDGKVIYVNLTEPGKEWNSSIHYHVNGRTDTFVESVLEQWRHIRPQDFQTQSKLTASDFPVKKAQAVAGYSKIQKGSSQTKGETEYAKRKRDDMVARPVSPSKIRKANRPAKYEDDEDYVVPVELSSPMKSKKQAGSNTKVVDQTSKQTAVTPTVALPNFKRLNPSSSPSTASGSKKRKASLAPTVDSDSESCELRTDEEDQQHRSTAASSRIKQAPRSDKTRSSPAIHKRAKASPKERKWIAKLRKDDFIVSDSEQDDGDSDFDNIPLIAELDSENEEEEEDTAYVQSSRSSTVPRKTSLRETASRRNRNAL